MTRRQTVLIMLLHVAVVGGSAAEAEAESEAGASVFVCPRCWCWCWFAGCLFIGMLLGLLGFQVAGCHSISRCRPPLMLPELQQYQLQFPLLCVCVLMLPQMYETMQTSAILIIFLFMFIYERRATNMYWIRVWGYVRRTIIHFCCP